LSDLRKFVLTISFSQRLLEPLRVPVASFIPLNTPYSYEPELLTLSAESLQRTFAQASLIEVDMASYAATSVIRIGYRTSSSNLPTPSSEKSFLLRVSKIGVLRKKEHMTDTGKKAGNRKWRPFSVLLTGSQLLFFRDLSWVDILGEEDSLSLPPGSLFKPDEVISLNNAIALIDSSYTKVRYILSLRMSIAKERTVRSMPIPSLSFSRVAANFFCRLLMLLNSVHGF
jgi:hypothetical protein